MTPRKQEKVFPPKYSMELIKIAAGDLQGASLLAAANPDRKENVIYLAQQALEKSLKAVLCAHKIPIPLIHDITALVAKIPEHLSPPFGYELGQLTEFAAIRRYIDGPESIEPEEIISTLQTVTAAVDWCKSAVEGAMKAPPAAEQK